MSRPADEHDQPMPTHGHGTSMQDQVIADLEKRKTVGMERYGTLLYPHNGRDMLRDAYEEALDLCVYLAGAIAERDAENERPWDNPPTPGPPTPGPVATDAQAEAASDHYVSPECYSSAHALCFTHSCACSCHPMARG